MLRGLCGGVAFPSEWALVPRHFRCGNRSAEGGLRLQRVFYVVVLFFVFITCSIFIDLL